MIDMKPYENITVGRGNTVRANHDDCPAGTDSRRRLYLSRPASSPDVVLGYCHNCQEHGVLRDGSHVFRDFDTKPTMIDKSIPFAQPPSLVPCVREVWPHDAITWRIHKSLSIQDCFRVGIKYDPDTHRVYLPMWDKVTTDGSVYQDSTLLGYQLRDISGTNCKYLTALRDKEVKPFTTIGTGKAVTYLVEDLASGLVLSRALLPEAGRVVNHRVVVNYGVKCTPEVLNENTATDYYVVWLDNDGDHIADQARIISRTWELFTGKPCYIEDQYGDPKAVDNTSIAAVDTYWRGEYNDGNSAGDYHG